MAFDETISGDGWLVSIAPGEVNQENAQARTLESYKRGGGKRPEPTLGALISAGWVAVFARYLRQKDGQDALNDVLTEPIYDQGSTNDGGTDWRVFLVPVSRFLDGGVRYKPHYREVWVARDAVSAARQEAQANERQLEADAVTADAELKRLQAEQAVALAQAKAAAEAQKAQMASRPRRSAIEVTIVNGPSGSVVTVANDPADIDAAATHPGVVVAGRTTQESVDDGLPLLAWQGGSVVAPATTEWASLKDAAAKGHPIAKQVVDLVKSLPIVIK